MKVAAALAFGALALAAPTPEANDATKIPFARKRHEHQRRADGTLDATWYLATLKHTILKYNPSFQLPSLLQDIDSVLLAKRQSNEPLKDQSEDGEDELYYGAGTVGKAKQTFTFDFDTGSSDTFVPGPSCGTSQGCTGTTKYNQQGTDEGNTTSITYGSGNVQGENYFDSVTVAGLTADKQNVISLTQAAGFSNSESDSLMGFAFQSIANSKQPPFFFTLINEGKISNKEFSFYLGRAQSGTGNNSELTIGGADASKYTGAFTKVPVTSQTYWQVALDSAKVNGKAADNIFESTKGQAAIDTGTTLIIAPSLAANAIYSKIPGSKQLPLASGSASITLYSYPCSANPKISLTFAGKDFAINPLDFNFGEISSDDSDIFGGLLNFGSSGPQCVGGIAGGDINPGQNLYVVGDTFLKSWYSTYSYTDASTASVNFAKAV